MITVCNLQISKLVDNSYKAVIFMPNTEGGVKNGYLFNIILRESSRQERVEVLPDWVRLQKVICEVIEQTIENPMKT